jgi:hypothetical protein
MVQLTIDGSPMGQTGQVIVLEGSNAGNNAVGLRVQSAVSHTLIQALVIQNFGGAGIERDDSNNKMFGTVNDS